MAWSGITDPMPYSAGNAEAIDNPLGEPIKVRIRHPGVGADGIVTFYDDGGIPIQTAVASAADPIRCIEFSASSTTLNISTGTAFASPGLAVDVLSAPAYRGKFDTLADATEKLPSASAGDFATTRDGNMLVFQGGA